MSFLGSTSIVAASPSLFIKLVSLAMRILNSSLAEILTLCILACYICPISHGNKTIPQTITKAITQSSEDDSPNTETTKAINSTTFGVFSPPFSSLSNFQFYDGIIKVGKFVVLSSYRLSHNASNLEVQRRYPQSVVFPWAIIVFHLPTR